MRILQRSVIAALALLVASTAVAPLSALAASKPKAVDAALLVKQSTRFVVLPPGKSITIWFDFKNVGTTTWTRDGDHPVGINTDDPLRRTSKFFVRAWRASWRPARVLQKTVKPGDTGRFRFAVKTPKNMRAGIWRERFVVTRDTKTKISGGEAELIVVVNADPNLGLIYRAQPRAKTVSLWVKPGERVYQPVDFRNVGFATFRAAGFGATSLVPLQSDGITASASPEIPLQSDAPIVKSAGRRDWTTAILDVAAPAAVGTYTQAYGLYGTPGVIANSAFTLELIVSDEPKPPLDAEPIVRVGVYSPAKTTTTSTIFKTIGVSANGPYELRNADTGEVLASAAASDVWNVQYDQKTSKYTYTLGEKSATTAAALRFVPSAQETIMALQSTSLKNFNQFRGTIEVRYAPATKKLWYINELPIELYLKGLGETGSTAPIEFVKTLVTAARTYALYKIFVGKSHDSESYKINSTTDQVYHGYGYEVKTPNITQGVELTRGMAIVHPSMITDRNKVGVIVAAYSSGTDGRTRSYYEVWGGSPDDYPYLVSVPDPNGIIPNAATLSGNHMVGLSATGALRTINKDGLTYDAILRYYYTGTSILRLYP